MSDTPSSAPAEEQKKPSLSGMFVELLFSIFVPAMILKHLSGEEMLGPSLALIFALSFPIALGVHGFIKEKKVGFIPAIGFLNTLLTGGIGLLKLPSEYIAYKEAAVPLVFALAVLITTYTKRPLIRVFLYNDMIMDTRKVGNRLAELRKEAEFDLVMIKATWMMAGSFVLSAILNFILAKWIVVSESGTDAFNDELGTLTLYSFPMIALPCMIITLFAMFYVFGNIRKLTGYELEEVMNQ